MTYYKCVSTDINFKPYKKMSTHQRYKMWLAELMLEKTLKNERKSEKTT